MKSSEVNIDVNKLQKLFKQKQKREKTEEEHEQRTGFLPYLSQTTKQKMEIHQEIEQEERDDEKYMLSHTFKSIQKLKSPSMFSQFDNTKTTQEVKKELEQEIKRKIGQKVMKLMTMRIQASKIQNTNLSDSLMTEIQESVVDQNLQEQINSPNVDVLEKQSSTSSIIKIEPFNDVNSMLDIAKIKSENNYGRNGIEDNELLQHNLDESIIDFQNDNFVENDSPNFLVYEKIKTSLLTESRQKVNRFKPKKTFQLTSTPRANKMSFNDSAFFFLKKQFEKSWMSPKQEDKKYHFYQKLSDLYFDQKDQIKNKALKNRKKFYSLTQRQLQSNSSQSMNLSSQKEYTQDEIKLKKIMKKIKNMEWETQGSQGIDQSFTSLSKSLNNVSQESIKQQYFSNKIHFPPLAQRKMHIPEYRIIEIQVPIPSEELPALQEPPKAQNMLKQLNVLKRSQSEAGLTPKDSTSMKLGQFLSSQNFQKIYQQQQEQTKYKIIKVKKRVRRHSVEQLNTHLLSQDIPIVNYEPKYGECPEQIGIQSFNDLLNEETLIENEQENLEKNMKSLRKVSQSLYESLEAYMLMFKVYQSENSLMGLTDIQQLVEWVVRARLFVMEVIEQYKLNSRNININDIKERELLVQRLMIKSEPTQNTQLNEISGTQPQKKFQQYTEERQLEIIYRNKRVYKRKINENDTFSGQYQKLGSQNYSTNSTKW
eukprot:403366663